LAKNADGARTTNSIETLKVKGKQALAIALCLCWWGARPGSWGTGDRSCGHVPALGLINKNNQPFQPEFLESYLTVRK